MATSFPSALDTLTNPTSSNPQNSPSHSEQHANANDAIEALEAKVGIDGSSVATSHEHRITQLEAIDHTHAWAETPSGSINDANVTFTLAQAPSPAASLMLFLNGILQRAGAGNDFTLSSATITFATAPSTGDVLLAHYIY